MSVEGDEHTKSSVVANALNKTYTYLSTQYTDVDIEILKKKLLSLAELESFDFQSEDEKIYSFDALQNNLAKINERDGKKKSRGVYYTPEDVVRFITYNTVRCLCGQLSAASLYKCDWDNISYADMEIFLDKTVLDPTCGTGEFLIAVLELKFALLDNRFPTVTESLVNQAVSAVYGNDINKESTTVAKIRIFLCTLKHYGVDKCLSVPTAVNKNFFNYDFVSSAHELKRKFDLIIGNPPYVEDTRYEFDLGKKYGNVYANVLGNANDHLTDDGVLGFVIPLSYISTPRMKKIRNELSESLGEQYILSYADRPDCLFKSVHQKQCILIGKKTKQCRRIYTGNYRYWYKSERQALFAQTNIVENEFGNEYYIPKLGTPTDAEIYRKVSRTDYRISLAGLSSKGEYAVYVNMRAAFWIKAFRCYHGSAEYKAFAFENALLADYFFCAVNSSLFWWYWVCVSDCWHITNKELNGFTVPHSQSDNVVTQLANALENKLESTKKYVGTKQTDYEYKHKACISEIHAIDDYIGGLFSLTDAENSYIKNFAYKYRVSGGAR